MPMKKARIVFQSRFGGYQLPAGVRWGENLASPWRGIARLMHAENLLPANFDTASVYTNERIDALNNFDAADVVAQAKAAKLPASTARWGYGANVEIPHEDAVADPLVRDEIAGLIARVTLDDPPMNPVSTRTLYAARRPG